MTETIRGNDNSSSLSRRLTGSNRPWLIVFAIVMIYVAAPIFVGRPTVDTRESVIFLGTALASARLVSGATVVAVLMFGFRGLPLIAVGTFFTHWFLLRNFPVAIGIAFVEILVAVCIYWIAKRIGFGQHATRFVNQQESQRQDTSLGRVKSQPPIDESLSRNLLELQEDERKNLAHEIHDGLVQYMVGALMAMDGISVKVPPDQVAASDNLDWSRSLIRTSIDELRHLINTLRPLTIDESGIAESIEFLINDPSFESIDVRFHAEGNEKRLPPLFETNIFRIVQEALANIRKHSQATAVEIRLFQAQRELRIEIEDNGVGFDLQDPSKMRFGIGSIVHRARVFGGLAEFQTSPGNGTKLRIAIPLDPNFEPESLGNSSNSETPLNE